MLEANIRNPENDQTLKTGNGFKFTGDCKTMPGKTEVDNFQSTRLRPYSGGRNPLSGDDIGKRSREVVHPQVNIVAIIAKHL